MSKVLNLISYLNNLQTINDHVLFIYYAYYMHNVIRYLYAVFTEIKWSHLVKVHINFL